MDIVEKRFWLHVDRLGPRQCWRWTGRLDKHGYGCLSAHGQPLAAHRVSAHLHGQNIEGMVVRHTCDNPQCVNPAHLLVGTVADNVRDRCERGRTRWKANGNFKLTDEQASQIRAAYAGRRYGDIQRIAAQYSIHPDTVRRIGVGERRAATKEA